jgi:hypothetical protein
MFVLVATWTLLLAGCGNDHPLAPLRDIGGPLAAITEKPDVAAPSNAVAVRSRTRATTGRGRVGPACSMGHAENDARRLDRPR